MRALISFGFLLLSSFALGQSKILPSDPCYKDYKSTKCLNQIRRNIFFMSTVSGKVRLEETDYVNDYFKRHGVEGFYGPDSQYHPDGSLFEYAIDGSNNSKFNKKLIESLPVGKKLFGKNIFGMVISKRPFTRSSDMQNYIHNLNILFPTEGNEKFQKTKEKFGLPWEDPSFVQKYLEQIKGVIKVIDDHNAFFKTTVLLSERKQLLEIKERVDALASLPRKACELNNIQEYKVFKQEYGIIYNSSSLDIIDCLVKSEKFALAGDIIKEGDYEVSKLPAYFDQALAFKETPEIFEYSKLLFAELSKKGQKINSKKGEQQRVFLQKGSQYLHSYSQEEETICNIDFGGGSKTIDEFTKDLSMIFFLEAYQLMEKILVERDLNLRGNLLEQFFDLSKVGHSLSLIHPTKGNTILHLIAEAGDHELLKKLEERGVSSNLLGNNVKDSSGNSPVIAAIKKGKTENIKFSIQYLKGPSSFGGDELSEILKATKKLKTDDPELKSLKKQLKWEVKEEMWDAY